MCKHPKKCEYLDSESDNDNDMNENDNDCDMNENDNDNNNHSANDSEMKQNHNDIPLVCMCDNDTPMCHFNEGDDKCINCEESKQVFINNFQKYVFCIFF